MPSPPANYLAEPSQFLSPMLAVTQPHPFDHVSWWYEVKWDGFRAIVSNAETLQIFSRRGHNLLARFPEFAVLHELLPAPVVLDGEVVALDQQTGTPREPSALNARDAGRVLIAFDCLYAQGHWLLHQPMMDRREHLTRVLPMSGPVLLAPGVEGRGLQLLEEVHRLGLEGVMAKKKDSPYRPGQRTRSWQKFFIYEKRMTWATWAEQKGGQWRWALQDPETNHMVANIMAPSDWEPPPGATELALRPVIRCAVWYRSLGANGTLRHPRLAHWERLT